jgi:L-histidine N-alpha-methyltransferase
MQRQLTLDVLVRPEDRRAALRRDVQAGLTAPTKHLPPNWFYDETGSRLFDAITRLPEYYLTRTERGLLAAHASDVAGLSGADTLVELGSGTSEKTRLLLDALAAAGTLGRITLLDISEEILRQAAAVLSAEYGVDVHAIVGDFRTHVCAVPPTGERRLWAFLGSTIGNFDVEQRQSLFADLRASMRPGDRLLLGTDLVKDVDRLVAAYDDAAGVTAEFNRNVLRVLDRELNANFEPDLFEHRAVWNDAERHVEMWLVARCTHTVRVGDLDLAIEFDAGEHILTETSAKFTPAQIDEELAVAGFDGTHTWRDSPGDYQLTLTGAVTRA